ncbi:MAG TPA: potassium-transporting ATPase subunit C [Nitrososphaerales archaeon]|nr:potassium-transporting ATPase subunit C [Nitrososphaerales archaeon]
MSSEPKKQSIYRPVVAIAFLSMIVCGFLFPLVITGIAQVAFPYQANGSLVQVGNRTVGSYYIDNGFTLPIFFHARNESNPLNASASGVDPDIPLQDAVDQIPLIHNATGIPAGALTDIVNAHVEYTLIVAGDPYVNVLELNIALITDYPSVYSAYR